MWNTLGGRGRDIRLGHYPRMWVISFITFCSGSVAISSQFTKPQIDRLTGIKYATSSFHCDEDKSRWELYALFCVVVTGKAKNQSAHNVVGIRKYRVFHIDAATRSVFTWVKLSALSDFRTLWTCEYGTYQSIKQSLLFAQRQNQK